MIEVDAGTARALAERLRALDIDPGRTLTLPKSDDEGQALANYWFYLVAICQHTVSLQGTIGGRWLRGWDYLEAASRRRLELFAAGRLSQLTADELRSIFSDDFDPAASTIDRVEERLGQLHTCARTLLSEYGGDVNELYRRSSGRLAGPGGILERLAHFEPYRDPVRKKAFLFLEMVGAAGIWDLQDPEFLRVPVDYHIMRIALRSGLVRVTDAGLERTLKERRPVGEDLDQLIRSRIEEACDLLVAESGRGVFHVDMALWHIGRSCCSYEHGPCCSGCSQPGDCSLVEVLGGACPAECPLAGACLGSRDPAYRAYWETNVNTSYY